MKTTRGEERETGGRWEGSAGGGGGRGRGSLEGIANGIANDNTPPIFSYKRCFEGRPPSYLTLPPAPPPTNHNSRTVTGKFDLFCRRVIKLIDMFSTIDQFNSLSENKVYAYTTAVKSTCIPPYAECRIAADTSSVPAVVVKLFPNVL